MASADEISHEGKIVSINPETTSVSIISESVCGSCHAAGLCSMSEMKEKKIEVPTLPDNSFKVGDEVYVMLKKSMGMKAVWISYLIPLAILMILILSLSNTSLGELAIGLISIVGVTIYYLIIYLFRDKIAKDYVFYLKEK